MANDEKLGVPVWTFFQGQGHGKIYAERMNDETVRIKNGEYIILFPEKAEPHSSLVAFDGFFLRHGLAGGHTVLSYKYFDGTNYLNGPEHIEIPTKMDNAKDVSGYESERSKLDRDYGFCVDEPFPIDARVFEGRSERYFVSIPKTKGGSHSIVCHLKPRSLGRRYIMIVVTYEEVRFVTANSY